MKITISKKRFNEILQEEVEKHKKVTSLESDKKKIEEALSRIQEAKSQEEIDEIWGGVKNLFNKGRQAAGAAIQNTANKVGTAVNNFGNKVGDKINQVDNNIQKQVQNIKTTYQQGEKEQAIKNAKQQIQKLWAQRQKIQSELNAMQAKYAELSGKKLGNQFQSKSPKQTPQNQPIQNQKAAE